MRIAGYRHLLGACAFRATRKNSIRKNKIPGPQIIRERADDSGADHQFRARHRIECAPRGFCRAFLPDSVSNDRESFAADVAAKATQAIMNELRPIADPALESSDFARKGVKNQNQSRDLSIELFDLERLSEPAYVSKIARVFFSGGMIS